MKFLAFIVLGAMLSFHWAAAAPSTITLTIDGESYTCGKGQGGNANSDCTVVQKNETDKAGNKCITDSDYWSHCAFYYKFGGLIYSTYESSSKSAADWCEAQIKSN